MNRITRKIFLLLFFFTSICYAQEVPLQMREPGSNQEPTFIFSANYNTYKDLLDGELGHLIQGGKLEGELYSRLDFSLRYEDELLAAAGKIKNPFSKNGSIRSDFPITQGLLFSEKELHSDQVSQTQLAEMVAWNYQSVLWSLGSISSKLSIMIFLEKNIRRKMTADFDRIYPAISKVGDRSNTLFKERLKLNSPDPVAGFSWITFRFRGGEEDSVWVRSPVNKNKSRQITGSNRADELLGGVYSLDDLLGWSGKPDLAVFDGVTQIRTLVPFASLNMAPLNKIENGCFVADFSQQDPGWNYENGRFPQAGPWIRSDSVWVPRDVYRITFRFKDPYLLYGRQVIIFDKESYLPLISTIYDRSGSLWKISVSGYGMSATQDGKNRLPVLRYSYIYDYKSEKAVSIAYDQSTYCRQQPPQMPDTLFDPVRQ